MLSNEILWWLVAWLCISLLVSPLIGKLITGPKCVRTRSLTSIENGPTLPLLRFSRRTS